MEKVVQIVQKSEDDSNLKYWRTRTPQQRLSNLERIRKEVIKVKYGTDPGFQRVIYIYNNKELPDGICNPLDSNNAKYLLKINSLEEE